MIMIALVDAGPTLQRFRALILWDSFTILCVSEDNSSFMGGSDIVDFVWVLLTGTIVAPFWVYWSVVWD